MVLADFQNINIAGKLLDFFGGGSDGS